MNNHLQDAITRAVRRLRVNNKIKLPKNGEDAQANMSWKKEIYQITNWKIHRMRLFALTVFICIGAFTLRADSWGSIKEFMFFSENGKQMLAKHAIRMLGSSEARERKTGALLCESDWHRA